MDIDLSALPDDVETLQRMVRGLAAERTALSEAQAEIERLRLIVQKLQRSQFGRRAERLCSALPNGATRYLRSLAHAAGSRREPVAKTSTAPSTQ
jgi:hypothetical protein